MLPVIITMVRHGESVDNLTSLWAGHRDAPLTVHGFNQALRLGAHFASIPITAIYTSDLKRARTTAQNIYDANKTIPKPPFTVSPLMREQFFGDAEGQPWNAGAFDSSHLPWEEHRHYKLANHAESLHEIGLRAEAVIRQFILPHLIAQSTSTDTPEQQHHVVLVAHGIFLSELMFALKRSSDSNLRFVKSPSGYSNTGWSRSELMLITPTSTSTSSIASDIAATHPATHRLALDSITTPGVLPPPLKEEHAATFHIRVVALNQTEHMEGLVRQKGGIGSSGHDAKQMKLESFFGGGGAAVAQ